MTLPVARRAGMRMRRSPTTVFDPADRSRPGGAHRHLGRSSSGFTLLELMVALAIAALLVATLFAAYHAATRTARHQVLRERGTAAAARVADQVGRDLRCAFHVPETPALRFLLQPPDADRPGVLALCTAVPPAGGTDLRWFQTDRVLYVRQDHALLRIVQPLPEERGEAVRTNILARGLLGFAVEARAGTDWTNAWTGTDAAPLPRAARVRVVAAGLSGGPEKVVETEILIPAGRTFTSRLERAGAGPGVR